MAIVKEFTCLAHGAFDSSEAVCPHGCGEGMVQRAFRTAPAIQSRSFRGINNTFETLARENGEMTTKSTLITGTKNGSVEELVHQLRLLKMRPVHKLSDEARAAHDAMIDAHKGKISHHPDLPSLRPGLVSEVFQ